MAGRIRYTKTPPLSPALRTARWGKLPQTQNSQLIGSWAAHASDESAVPVLEVRQPHPAQLPPTRLTSAGAKADFAASCNSHRANLNTQNCPNLALFFRLYPATAVFFRARASKAKLTFRAHATVSGLVREVSAQGLLHRHAYPRAIASIANRFRRMLRHPFSGSGDTKKPSGLSSQT